MRRRGSGSGEVELLGGVGRSRPLWLTCLIVVSLDLRFGRSEWGDRFAFGLGGGLGSEIELGHVGERAYLK